MGPTNSKLQLLAGHFGFLMLTGKQAGRVVSILMGIIRPDHQAKAGLQRFDICSALWLAPLLLLESCEHHVVQPVLNCCDDRHVAQVPMLPNIHHMSETILVTYTPAKPPAECAGGMSKPEETAGWFRPQTHN